MISIEKSNIIQIDSSKVTRLDIETIKNYTNKQFQHIHARYAEIIQTKKRYHEYLCHSDSKRYKFPGEQILGVNVTPTTRVFVTENFICVLEQDSWFSKGDWILKHLDKWKKERFNLDKFSSAAGEWTEYPFICVCGNYAAKELIAQIKLGNLLVDEVASMMLIQRAPLPIPETEPPLYEDTPLIAAGSVMVGSMKAQLKKKEWTEDSNGIALFVYREKGNPNIIKHYISNPGQISLLPWDEAEQIIDKFGFTTAKLHLLFAAYAVQQEKPWESKFSLKASNLVKTLGWDRNHNKNQCEKLLDIANTAYALDQLVVESAWVDGINKKGQPFGSNSVGRIWNVSISPYGQMNIEGKVEQPTEVYITVQPGLWTEEFLNRAGAISKEALYQFGYISQEILKIDPYHDELALRLAIHLTLESSSHTSGNYQVRDLLEAVLPKPQINAARTNCKKAYNLKQQWDSALKLLMSLGWQVDFDTTYPEWLQPGNKERNPRGYLDKLLTARITILPPDPIPKLLTAKTESKPLLLKSATSFDLTGTQIRDARENKGWSQAKLAGWLGVSRSLVALIERGQRPISDKLKPKLRKLLKI